MLRMLRNFFIGIFAILGFLTFILLAPFFAAFFILDDFGMKYAAAPDKIVLSIDMDGGFVEASVGGRIEGFSLRPKTTLQDAVIDIRKAADDPRVIALKSNLSTQALGLAQIQDVRDAIFKFRATGKPAFLFSETIGEGIGALPSYYLASAFSDIWVQPSGTVGVSGIVSEQPFIKDFLERFGLKGRFLQRKEYKSAGEIYTNSEMSPANREATEGLIQSWFKQIVTGIAEARSLDNDTVRSLIDRGPLLSGEALESGLIDNIGYRDEFETALVKNFGIATSMRLSRYLEFDQSSGKPEPKKTIALIHAVGEITRGGSESQIFSNNSVNSSRISKAIREAANDKDIDALIIRIDSPGGSYVASDIIWRELKNAKKQSKPIIVSMGDTAASGGYYIAMPADRIFAQPATVTGSIGVILGKLIISDAAEKLGVHFERISLGDSAGMFSSLTDFNETDLKRLNQMLDATYADFTNKAAESRDMSIEEIDKVARGRIWSGRDAFDVGLVDELGGLGSAIDYTKTQIGLEEEDSVWLVPFPAPEDTLSSLIRVLEEGQLPFGIMSLLQASAWIKELFSPVFAQYAALQHEGVQLYMLPISAN